MIFPPEHSLIDEFARVSESIIHGMGLIATKHIPAGTYLGEYEGNPVALKDMSQDDDITYVVWLDSYERGLDGTNNWRFANSSSTPNIRHEGTGDTIEFYAAKDIQPGEELTWDYLRVAPPAIDPNAPWQRFKRACSSAKQKIKSRLGYSHDESETSQHDGPQGLAPGI